METDRVTKLAFGFGSLVSFIVIEIGIAGISCEVFQPSGNVGLASLRLSGLFMIFFTKNYYLGGEKSVRFLPRLRLRFLTVTAMLTR